MIRGFIDLVEFLFMLLEVVISMLEAAAAMVVGIVVFSVTALSVGTIVLLIIAGMFFLSLFF